MKAAQLHVCHVSNRLVAIIDMLAALPPVHTLREVDHAARVLANFTSEQRACWATCCGHPDVNTSDDRSETWALFVARARARKPVTVGEVRTIHAARGQ